MGSALVRAFINAGLLEANRVIMSDRLPGGPDRTRRRPRRRDHR